MQQTQIRTKAQEQVIQEFTPEQQEWKAIVGLYHEQQMYAQDIARRILGLIHEKAKKHGVVEALTVAANRRVLYQIAREYQVADDHIDLCIRLVRKCAKVRYSNVFK